MTPAEIRLAIEELRGATRPEQRTAYERALLGLADLVDRTTTSLDGYVLLRLNRDQSSRIDDLRAAIPHHPPITSTEGIS